MNSTPSTAPEQNRLQGEPFIFAMEDLRLEITVGIANDRVDMIEEFQNCGAFNGSWSEDEKYLFLYHAPATLIHQAYPDALNTLKLHVHLIDSRRIPITYAHGTFSEIECALKEFLDTSPDWNSVAQERGVFVGGSYFTSDSFLYLDKDYFETSMRIAIISRTRLEAAVHAELKKLKEFLQ